MPSSEQACQNIHWTVNSHVMLCSFQMLRQLRTKEKLPSYALKKSFSVEMIPQIISVASE